MFVTGGGTLVMRSCDVRGGGPGVSELYGNAYYGGGVIIDGGYSVGDFYNVTFIGLRATYGGALHAGYGSGKEDAVKVRLFGCQFLRNSAASIGVVCMWWYYTQFEFYDSLFANNDRGAVFTYGAGAGQIVRCTFRENSGSDNSFPGSGAASLFSSMPGELTSISDSIFLRNTGHIGGSGGGALALSRSVLLSNVSFLANTALGQGGGGAFHLGSGCVVTVVNCFALGNVGANTGGGFRVEDSELTVINSTCHCLAKKKREEETHAIVSWRALISYFVPST